MPVEAVHTLLRKKNQLIKLDSNYQKSSKGHVKQNVLCGNMGPNYLLLGGILVILQEKKMNKENNCDISGCSDS